MALAEIGSLAERRIALLTDPALSGLPAFLAPAPGLNSGFMLAQVSAAALASENQHLAHPVAIDSRPTSANQEDHVSMATYAARRLLEMTENAAHIVAIELLAAAQGIELRRPLPTSRRLEAVLCEVRRHSAFLAEDRALAGEISGLAAALLAGELAASSRCWLSGKKGEKNGSGDRGTPRDRLRVEPGSGQGLRAGAGAGRRRGRRQRPRRGSPRRRARKSCGGRPAASITPVAADVTTREGQAKLLAALPDPDILVTNAGGPPFKDFRALDRNAILTGVTWNMVTPIELIQATIDPMIARGFGRIVNITSISVRMPIQGLDLSSGARAGLTAFVAGVARSVAHAGVTINNVLPGFFDTDRYWAGIDATAKVQGKPREQFAKERENLVPARRIGDPQELGDACAFLCSARAGYITGQNLLLDGGLFNSAF